MARASYSATPLLSSLVHRPQGVILVLIFTVNACDYPGKGMDHVQDHPHHRLAEQEEDLGEAGPGDACELHTDAKKAAGRDKVLLLRMQLLGKAWGMSQ